MARALHTLFQIVIELLCWSVTGVACIGGPLSPVINPAARSRAHTTQLVAAAMRIARSEPRVQPNGSEITERPQLGT
jgi:hypothetical protein